MTSMAGKIVVLGANGALGRELLHAIGPDRAIAATRGDATPSSGFAHVRLGAASEIPASVLSESCAIINAAGAVRGAEGELMAANVRFATDVARQARDAGVAKFVQVGSFSVYGYASTIDRETPIVPVTAYGRSKAAADHALFDLMTDRFLVKSVRLPFLFSEHRPALLKPLIALGRRLRMLPGGQPPMRRSMITYADAASILTAAAITDGRGVTLAADPQPFDYDLLRRLVEEECGVRWRVVPLPAMMTAAVTLAAPAIGRRLFRSSVLSAAANDAGSRPLGLEATLRRIVRALIR